jgi:hypothetical protein
MERIRDVAASYEPPGEQRPLMGYLALLATYGTGLAAVAAAVRLTGRGLPDQVGLQDLTTITVATHKISRLVTKDAVTSPLRAPLTRFTGPAGTGEVNETVRHLGGFRHAAGEMVTCPFCTAVWTATGLTAGLVLAPRLTRLVAAAATAVAGADFLHLAYDIVRQRARRDSQHSVPEAGDRAPA